MSQKSPEILAPAGSREALEAAVRCGADAVYLGGKDLSARQNARNFDAGELKEAAAYCRQRGVRLYLTLNTLLTDSQLPALETAARTAMEAGVDAVLVQDLGVLAWLRACCPGLPLHASTQMVIHNLPSARAAAALGCSRVVLARECSREEIAAITAGCGVETEVFVHGALCMSVSGQCYLSSIIGRRSGNRGLCAQPCRLPFAGPRREYSLSLRDLTLVDRLEELAGLGVASFKIEGRMKRPEYVAAAVTACRRALEGQPVDFDKLAAVFSRSGFTQSYYLGQPGREMFGIRQKEDVTAATGKLLGEFEALYRAEAPRVPVDMTLRMEPGAPAALTLEDGTRRVELTGETPQAALHKPTDEELARRALAKTGGTPYFLRELHCAIAPGLMLPVSALNALRASGLEQLDALRAQPRRQLALDAGAWRAPAPCAGNAPAAPALRARLQTAAQLSPALLEHCQLVSLPWWELAGLPGWEEQTDRLGAEVPNILFGKAADQALQQLEDMAARGLQHVWAGNLGMVAPLARLGLTVHGTHTLNVTNSAAAAEYARLGLDDLELSFELGLEQAKGIRRVLPLGLAAYGWLPLMYTRSCPLRGEGGCGDCPGRGTLTDRLGNRFEVDCVRRQHSRLLNTLPLYLGDHPGDLRGFDWATMYFTHETAGQCGAAVELFRRGEAYPGKRTHGLYGRGPL